MATVAPILFSASTSQYGRGVSTGKTWQQSSNVIGIYAQDTWRFTDRLTLNLGLRYDAHYALGRSQQSAGELQHCHGQYRPRRQERSQSRSLRRNLGRQRFPTAYRFRMDSCGSGRSHRDPWCVHNLVLYGRYGHKPSSDIESAIYSGRNQRDLQRHSAASDRLPPMELRVQPRQHLAMRQSMLATHRLSSESGIPKVQPAIADQWNVTVQHQFAGNTTAPGWIRRAEGNSLDGAIRLRAEGAAAEFGLRHAALHSDSPYFAANPALYSVLAVMALHRGLTVQGRRFQAPSPTAP